MRAWAGSYTPQGRSQCAVASHGGEHAGETHGGASGCRGVGSSATLLAVIDSDSAGETAPAGPAAGQRLGDGPGHRPLDGRRRCAPATGCWSAGCGPPDAVRPGDVVLARFPSRPDLLVVKRVRRAVPGRPLGRGGQPVRHRRQPGVRRRRRRRPRRRPAVAAARAGCRPADRPGLRSPCPWAARVPSTTARPTASPTTRRSRCTRAASSRSRRPGRSTRSPTSRSPTRRASPGCPAPSPPSRSSPAGSPGRRAWSPSSPTARPCWASATSARPRRCR